MKALTFLLVFLLSCHAFAGRRAKRSTIPLFKNTSDNKLSHNECGLVHENDDRAWLAKIEIADDIISKHCFGSVVSNRYIVTSAICVESADLSNIRVSFAKTNYQEFVTPTDKVVHEDFRLDDFRANLAILRFAKDLLKNGVLPICLWNKAIEKEGSTITENAGIATLVGKDVSSDDIVVGKFKIQPASACKAKVRLPFQAYFENSNICLLYEDGLSSCLRGFGAPIQFKIGERWFLRGLYNVALKKVAGEVPAERSGRQQQCRKYQVISVTDAARYVDFLTKNTDISLQSSVATSILESKNFRSYLNCGVRSKDLGTKLAFGGVDATLREFPWSAALFKVYYTQLKYSCVGSLISKKFILTAAHCVDEKGSTAEAGSLVVALGKELLNSGWTKDDGVSIHSVRSVIKHEEYDHNLVKNDIALLQLTRSVETTITVSPLCLWYKSSSFELLNNVNGTIAGWGLIQDYNLADQLQRLDLPILNPNQCKLIEGKETFYSTKMRASPKFCAGYVNKNKSPCNGDSGAALVVEENGVFYARGIVSETVARNIDGGKFCNTDYPAIFTDVAAYRRWIIEHTDDELKYSYIP
ncbi:inactive CLIP domain-containing serine protease A8-like isoform X2 [Cloeon dipterum]|uniref:inactive CLIP domain-containing serine protease A8-like isoform X1 n=1 Tax=Cloeon dipterum TaxID=197152 RepID=UPI00321FEEC0